MKKNASRRLLLLTGLGTLVLFGCSGSSSSSTAAATATTLATSTDASQSVSLTGLASALPSGVTTSSLSVTPKAASDVPAAPVEASFLAAVECGPAGTAFSSAVTLTFKLATARTAGESLPVYLLNTTTNAWDPAGTDAVVSADGLSAAAPITHFSTYGLFAPVTATLAGDKYFEFSTGVNSGGGPSEIMYDDVNQVLMLPHAAALAVTDAYGAITQAPFGTYKDSNGVSALTFAPSGVYVMRSIIPSIAYYKVEILSHSARSGSVFGAVTFKYEKILPLPIVSAVGEWQYTSPQHLSVLMSTVGMDFTAANSDFYMIDGNYTDASTLTGTFTRSSDMATGNVTVTLSLGADGKLNATLTGDAPLGTVTLTGGVKQ